MIKVNLVGAGRKKKAPVGLATPVGFKIAMPASVTPVLLILIVLATGGGGYWWYAQTASTLADLDKKKADAEKEKAALEAVIKADQVFETRKKALENRVKIIENLQKNQVSPVIALDELAEAVERTKWVWLSNLDQRDGVLNMSGTATSLNAIADLRTGPAAAPDVSAPDPAAGSAAERRQLTVMVYDLVGSTALSARLDPEELREVIGAYHRCVADAVRRFDGFVAKYMGDGVLIYFGFPRAHEDDAERAVRAGLGCAVSPARTRWRCASASPPGSSWSAT